MRGSDVNATLYYLARMIQAGEDAKFIARRMVIFASEDVGIAAPAALTLAVSTFTRSDSNRACLRHSTIFFTVRACSQNVRNHEKLRMQCIQLWKRQSNILIYLFHCT
jgi:hypothetical protein